jgi:alpha-L-rhamnosidase
MKKIITLLLFIICILHGSFAQDWQAQWISAPELQNKANTWLAFRKTITIEEVPSKAIAKIAADSKYWLWINGELVVFEGGLKRGPNPEDTYYDEVDIAPWLKNGENIISVKLWYFGKDGFSHKSSGKAGLLFDCQSAQLSILSDKTWKCKVLEAYQTAGEPLPNFRLSESSLLYDARKEQGSWHLDASVKMPNAIESGSAGSPPWNNLVVRPIPFWKDYGFRNYEHLDTIASTVYDTIICQLPYNAQLTPYMRIEAPQEGQKVTIFTDNYLHYNGGANNIRSEYITRKGVQEYESLGWINGHRVYYIIPKGVKVLELKFRETGYNTDFAGSFTCSDPFFNKLWEKARRTLYLTMRDTYMDCPERERAQWTGDAVNQSGQAFYSLSVSSHALTSKWLNEIVDWQRNDEVLYAPVPAGNWNKELPGQLLATVGFYGLWNYYLHSGDKKTLAHAYNPAKKYLNLWETDGAGLVKFRGGDWTWGDWGNEKDIVLIYNAFYYLALKGMGNAAIALGHAEDAAFYATFLKKFKQAFNKQYWTGQAYRNPDYEGQTDDRVQALAVVSGIADEDKYPQLLKIFRESEHASPYMEKYVMEALFQMDEVDIALERHKKRFEPMVNYPGFTTLWETWNFNDWGTINHSWSGGGLTVLSQYLCGIAPLEPGYKAFQVIPQPGSMKNASATVSSVAGEIKSSFENTADRFSLNAQVPPGTTAIIGIPLAYKKIKLNNKIVWKNGKYKDQSLAFMDGDTSYVKFKVQEGVWEFTATDKSK